MFSSNILNFIYICQKIYLQPNTLRICLSFGNKFKPLESYGYFYIFQISCLTSLFSFVVGGYVFAISLLCHCGEQLGGFNVSISRLSSAGVTVVLFQGTGLASESWFSANFVCIVIWETLEFHFIWKLDAMFEVFALFEIWEISCGGAASLETNQLC